MGVPILTSDGIVGQRIIVDDYYKAGETLKAGESVAFAQDPNTPFLPTVWRVDDDGSAHQDGERCIGVIYSAPGDTPGTTVKGNAGDLVPVVILGITKAISDGAIGVGDACVGANTLGRVVGTATPTAGKIFGKCLKNTSGAGEAFDMQVAIG